MSGKQSDLLIVAAMKEEAADIMSGGDHEVLVTGIGTLPAAIALTRRLSEGPLPSRVVNVGTAGALVDLAPGVYEVSDAVKHDFKVGGTSEITDFVYPRWFTFEPLTDLPKAKLATGDAFVNRSDLRDELARECQLVDMEGYALAAVCSTFGVPLTLLKQVSDSADESASEVWEAALERARVELEQALREHLR